MSVDEIFDVTAEMFYLFCFTETRKEVTDGTDTLVAPRTCDTFFFFFFVTDLPPPPPVAPSLISMGGMFPSP